MRDLASSRSFPLALVCIILSSCAGSIPEPPDQAVSGVRVADDARIACKTQRDDLSLATVALLVCDLEGVVADQRVIEQIAVRIHKVPEGGAARPCCCVDNWCECPDPVVDLLAAQVRPFAEACSKESGGWLCSPEALLEAVRPSAEQGLGDA